MNKNDQQPPPEENFNPAEDVLSGGIRGEVAGCPTGLSHPAKPRPQDKKEPEQTGPVDRTEGRGGKP
jgi:hypothetical protein